MTNSSTTVLVTGGSGFIASHCIARLLADGFGVRTTVRSLDRAEGVRRAVGEALAAIGTSGTGTGLAEIEFAVADLTEDAGWVEAVTGCEFVLHVASPVPHGEVPDPESVIRPARDGALRVLRAARDAGVRRVVLTSAFGAVGFGYGTHPPRFTEENWSVLDGPGMSTYNKSKTLAERAAWEFVSTGEGPELVTICPVAVFGPVLGQTVSGGNELIRMLVTGELRMLVDIWFPIVDVRDVASAHVAALRVAEAAGQRFIIGSGEGLSMPEIAEVLRTGLGADGRRVPRRTVPNWLVRAVAKVVPAARSFADEIGARKDIDVDKAQRILGLHPRSAREALLDSARSMIQRGLVKTKK